MTNKPVIGVAGPFSGPRAAYGNMLKSISIASVPHGADIIFGDDGADPARASAVAHCFANVGVCAVIGHFNSECAAAAGKTYRKFSIPLLLPASTKPHLAGSIGAFRLCPTDDMQARTMTEWLGAHESRVVEVWVDGSAYGERIGNLVRVAAADAGIAVSFLPEGGTSRTSTVIFCGAHYAVARAIDNCRRQGLAVTALCCDDCSVEEFAGLVGDDGAVYVAVPNPGFETGTRLAFAVLRDVGLYGEPIEIRNRVAAHRAFSGHEARAATFTITALGAAIR